PFPRKRLVGEVRPPEPVVDKRWRGGEVPFQEALEDVLSGQAVPTREPEGFPRGRGDDLACCDLGEQPGELLVATPEVDPGVADPDLPPVGVARVGDYLGAGERCQPENGRAGRDQLRGCQYRLLPYQRVELAVEHRVEGVEAGSEQTR